MCSGPSRGEIVIRQDLETRDLFFARKMILSSISVLLIWISAVQAITWTVHWAYHKKVLNLNKKSTLLVTMSAVYDQNEKIFSQYPLQMYRHVSPKELSLAPKNTRVPPYTIKLSDSWKECNVVNEDDQIAVQCMIDVTPEIPIGDQTLDSISRRDYDVAFIFALRRDRSYKSTHDFRVTLPLDLQFMDPNAQARSLQKQGIALVQAGSNEQALKVFTDALANGPLKPGLSASLHLNRAVAFKALNRLNQCISDAQMALKFDPSKSKALWLQGICFKDLLDNRIQIPAGVSDVNILTYAITTLETAMRQGFNQDSSGTLLEELKVKAASMSPDSLYSILESNPGAPKEAIRSKYLQKARATHPDKNPEDPHAKEKFQKLKQAYDVLSDDSKRRRYDEDIVRQFDAKRQRRQ